MTKKLLAILLCFVSIHSITIAQGINFSTGSWKEIIAKAKKEKKLVFVDIYAEWCGPCKKMTKDIFTQASVGEYYNKNFVNYKIDAEKGEGIQLAQKYSVQAYPTIVFINPSNESIVVKYMGACEAAEMVVRGQNALNEYTDPMKWDDYLKKINAKKYDKALIQKALEKAQNSQRNNDYILDIYVREFADTAYNEEELQYVVNHTKTLDNIAVDYIASHLNFQQRDAFMEEFTSELNIGTYEKAVETKNPAILDRIKTNKYQSSTAQSTPTHYYFLAKYYNALGDTTNYWKTVESEANYYVNKPLKDFTEEDAIAYTEIKKNYKNQLSLYGVPESQHEQSIKEAIDQNPQARLSVTYMTAMQLNEHITNLLMQKGNDKVWLQKALPWGDKMVKLVKDYPLYSSYFSISYAYVLTANGRKEEAKTLLNKALSDAKGNAEIETSIKQALQDIN